MVWADAAEVPSRTSNTVRPKSFLLMPTPPRQRLLVCLPTFCSLPRARHHASRVTVESPLKPIQIMLERSIRSKTMSRGLATSRLCRGRFFPSATRLAASSPGLAAAPARRWRIVLHRLTPRDRDSRRVPAECDEPKVDQECEEAAPHQIEELVEDEEDTLRGRRKTRHLE